MPVPAPGVIEPVASQGPAHRLSGYAPLQPWDCWVESAIGTAHCFVFEYFGLTCVTISLAGPMTIEAISAEQSYSPFHMMAGGLAYCTFSVMHSWASNAKLDASDLTLEVAWTFGDKPHRVAGKVVDLRGKPIAGATVTAGP